ncbi:hypothetical protein EYF80_024373 [Liparis tanakae]|uniref:Uncharacterized protein n=1 Tax=Liparis tanakae TaxID=230148 RepID=A0A4Z2HKS2_9TELE|nr:hypothetical protein EYF80_024373 [Liparis tanakae]
MASQAPDSQLHCRSQYMFLPSALRLLSELTMVLKYKQHQHQHQRRRCKTRSRRLAKQPRSRATGPSPDLSRLQRTPLPPFSPHPPPRTHLSPPRPEGRKEGSEILLPCAIIPTDRRRYGLPVTRRWRRGEAGGRWEGAGGRRQRSSEREEERLKAATEEPKRYTAAAAVTAATTTAASTDTAAAAAALGAPRLRHGNSASVAPTAALSVGHVVIRGLRQWVFYP